FSAWARASTASRYLFTRARVASDRRTFASWRATSTTSAKVRVSGSRSMRADIRGLTLGSVRTAMRGRGWGSGRRRDAGARPIVSDEFTAGVDAFDELDSGPVGQVAAARRVEDGQVGASSGPEVADVGSLQGVGTSGRCRPHRLFDGEMHVPDADRDGEGHAVGEPGAGVAVRGDGQAHPGVDVAPGVGIG